MCLTFVTERMLSLRSVSLCLPIAGYILLHGQLRLCSFPGDQHWAF